MVKINTVIYSFFANLKRNSKQNFALFLLSDSQHLAAILFIELFIKTFGVNRNRDLESLKVFFQRTGKYLHIILTALEHVGVSDILLKCVIVRKILDFVSPV